MVIFMSDLDINSLDWEKMNGLLPAIIQHAENGEVLMLVYMNQEALIATLTSGQLNLYSRRRKRLWRKGESSGNSMAVTHISANCNNDSLLVHVVPKGPACHLGYSSCFQPSYHSTLGFIDELIQLINKRAEHETEKSYTVQLLESGVVQCAKKTGEKALETIISASTDNKEQVLQESADLIFHLLVLLKACQLSFYDVLLCLQEKDRTAHA
jgi:phosphoribosyl-ATP pyrophosphohydrolase/phosphoribosyl-AMP cyclohydrolase